MWRRIITFMLIPAMSGFLATLLFLMQGGIGDRYGPFDLVIGFLQIPSILMILPAGDVLSSPDIIRDHDFLMVIGFPTLLNLGLFALAGFVSWTWFPCPRINSTADELSSHLRRAGWSIQDVSSSAICVVTGVKGENVISAEGGSRVEAFRRAYEQVAAVEALAKVEQPSNTNLLFAIVCIVLGHLCEAFNGWFLLVFYGFASINGPGVQGMKQLSLTLEKMLNPRDGLWGTLLLLAGIIGGLLFIFAGCYRLSQVAGGNTSINITAIQERPLAP